jgi:ankyrin repeat protein
MKRLKDYKIFETEKPLKAVLGENLLVAAHNNNVEEIRNLINKGADINYTDHNNWSALIYAARYDKLESLKELIKLGADINIKAKDCYWTPLKFAAHNHNMECLKELIKAGADLNAQDDRGDTILIVSAYKDDIFCILELIKAGADMTIRNNNGDNFIDKSFYSSSFKTWLNQYDAQERIIVKEPSLISSFEKKFININPRLKKEYPHLFTGVDLNLL